MTAVEFQQHTRTTEAEADVQGSITELLQKSGWMVVRINSGGHPAESGRWVWNYFIHGFGNAGFPDLVAFRRHNDVTAEALLVEVKRKKGAKTRKTQKLFRFFASSMGIPVHQCNDWSQVHNLVKKLGQ